MPILVFVDAETERQKAIAAYKAGALSEKIVIYPAGKRTARRVKTNRGTQIRLYLSGKLYARGVSVEDARKWVL